MDRRPRIDLDGVTLADPHGPSAAVAVVRGRTVEGLVLAMPESADVLVPWAAIEHANLDLADGTLRVRFTPAFVRESHWLGGLAELEGRWTDRVVLRRDDVTRR